MDWKDGLKRMSLVLAIVTAIVCGLIGRAFPYKRHEYVHKVNNSAVWSWRQYNNGKITAEEMDKKELSIVRMYGDFIEAERGETTKEIIDEMNKKRNRGGFGQTEDNPEIQQIINHILEYRQKTNFWYDLSRTQLMWLSVLFSFIDIVVGFIGGWIFLWLRNLYVYYRWKIYELDFPCLRR